MKKLLLLLAAYCLLINTYSNAQGSSNPAVNNPISTASGNQQNPTIVSDGTGGAIITWKDYRNGNWDIYAQRINSCGAVQWTANGVAVCTAVGDQESPTLVSDGSGGAIITWDDCRSGTIDNYDIYAQRINTSGAVQWIADGVAIGTATWQQLYPTIVSDGSGGAIISWQDHRNGGGNWDIYAKRIMSTGALQWAANGVAICTAASSQGVPTIVSDSSGGAIITWQDNRNFTINGTNFDIYCQRINSSGAVQWTANGIAICTEANNQGYPTIITDGNAGAIITWTDPRSLTNDIYAQRINASGAVQWNANGVGISTEASNQQNPTIVSDFSGGAIITWNDSRSGNWDIYVQRINASGAVQWTSNGVGINTEASNQQYPTTVPDGSGGAIITWIDDSSGNWDIYAQRINSSGAVQWTADGVAIGIAAGDQQSQTIVSGGSAGGIITWSDYRSGNWDIYAQRIFSVGTLSAVTANAIATTVCAGASVTLTGGGADTYVWTGGVTNGVGFNPPTGITTYTVTGTVTLTGCTSTATITITVNPLPVEAGAISGTTLVCQGENSLTYTVPPITNATSYIWTLPTGATGTSITNSITVNYGASAVSGNIIVKGINSCGDGVSTSLPITVNIKPNTPIISQTGNILNSNASSGNQWYNQNGLIVNAVSQNYNLVSDGNYYVIVTNSNGCSSNPSNILNAIVLGVNNYELDNLILYPNPIIKILHIEIEKEFTGTIYDITGKTLINVNSKDIDVSSLSPGIYLLDIISENKHYTKKLIKQ